MAVVTEKWSEGYESEETSQKVFEVSGVNSKQEARNAVPFQFNSSHDKYANQKATKPRVSNISPTGFYRVEVDFSIPEGGGSHTDPGVSNPLLLPPRILWQRATLSQPADIDVYGNKISNAAGDGFNPRANRGFTSRTVTIRFYRVTFPYELAEEFEDKVSNTDITLTNSPIQFKAHHVKCLSLMPTEEFPADAQYVELALMLEVRSKGYRPFQDRFVNQGRYGYYVDGGTTRYGPITTKVQSEGEGTKDTYQPVTEDVLLDRQGRPMNTTLFIGDGKTPSTNPNPPPTGANGYNLDTTAPGPALIYVWDTSETANLNELFTSLGLT